MTNRNKQASPIERYNFLFLYPLPLVSASLRLCVSVPPWLYSRIGRSHYSRARMRSSSSLREGIMEEKASFPSR